MDRVLIYRVVIFGLCGYALIRGKREARIVASVFLVGNFATLALRSPLAQSYSSVETGIMLVDVLCFLAFTYVALISDRFWPLWVSGLQLTTSLGHLLKAFDEKLLPLAYATALRFWTYPILIILTLGVWRSHRRSLEERASAAGA